MKTLTLACISAALLLSGCVSKQKYADLEKQHQELTQAMNAEIGAKDMKIWRMQDAIKLSINSGRLFPAGEWEVSEKAKSTLTKVVTTLAPYQTTKIRVKGYTDDTPTGPGLAKQGVTSNLILSQERADSVMQLTISKGANPSLISAQRVGEAEPVAPNDTRRAARRTAAWNSPWRPRSRVRRYPVPRIRGGRGSWLVRAETRTGGP